MALKQNIVKKTFGVDVQLTDTYLVIDNINGDKKTINIKVIIYTDATKSEVIEHWQFGFTPSLEDVNFIKQGYNFIKSLPEFQSSIDC